jgi:hypothetical protein
MLNLLQHLRPKSAPGGLAAAAIASGGLFTCPLAALAGETNGPFLIPINACGTLGIGPQSCTVFTTTDGVSYFIDNTQGFGPGETVYVAGMVDFDAPCFPVGGSTIVRVEAIGACYQGCGTLGIGPQGCTLFIGDDGQTFAPDNIGRPVLGEQVFVIGAVQSRGISPCFPAQIPALQGNLIGPCVDSCGEVVFGAECPLFASDEGGLYAVNAPGGLQVGDRIHVTGMLDPECVSICQQGDGCVLNATVNDCSADLTNDGSVNGADLGALLLHWGQCISVSGCIGDITNDAIVDGADLGELLLAWTG